MREGWEIRKVKEICDKASSNIAQKEIAGLSGDYPVYGASGYVQNVDFFHRDKPYIGIVKDGSGVGRVNTYPAKTSLLGTLQYIIPKDGYSLGYVAYLLKSLNLVKFAAGAAIPHIYFKDYGECKVSVPPIVEQEKIVAELDCLTGIIEKKKQQLKELDNLAQSIFYDMFGDPIINEKGWEVKCIGEVCSLKSGNSNANNSAPGDLPYVKVGDMGIPGNESRITTSSQFVSRDGNLKGIFPIGTTIFPKRGGAIYTNKKRLTAIEICCDLNTMGVIPNKDILHPLYLFQYFLGLDLGALCNGAAIPQLNNCDIAPLKIEVPSLDLQNAFAQKIEAIEKQKEMIKNSIQETETLFNSRMDYWFN